MKTFKFTHLIVVLLLLTAFVTKAQKTLYVDNFHVGSVAFSSLQIALDSAKNGDIIMLQGSPKSYGNVAIKNKSVSIIGAGHHPKNQNAYATRLDNIELSPNTKNVTLDGLVFDIFNTTSSENLLDITVRNCQINNGVNLGNQANHWLFYSNVFEKDAAIKSAKSAFLNDVNFANNFFYQPQIGLLGSSQNVRFGENLFSGNEVGKRAFVFQQMSNVLIENNLFYHIYSFENVNHNNSCENNSSTECDLSLGSKFETSGVNPKFSDYKGGRFEPQHDFRNVTSVGLYTGKYEFSMTGEPQGIAQIRTLTIQKQALNGNKLDFEANFTADAARIFSQNPSLNFKINNYLEKYANTDWKNITEVECFLDTDPCVCNATKLNTTAAATLDIKNTALSFANTQTNNGERTLFVRVKNNENRWSHLQSFAFFVEKTDISMKLENVPVKDCAVNTPECFKFIVKNEGTKTIPAQNVDLLIFNKKASHTIAAQIGTIVPNGFVEFVICDKNRFLIEKDSIFVTLSSDYLNSHDFNPTNQIVAIPFVTVDTLSLKVYDIKGILCHGGNDGRAEIKVENDINFNTNKYQWSYTTPEGVVLNYKHGFHLGLNTLAPGWHTAKAISPNGCEANTRFFVPDAKPLNVTLVSDDYNGVQISCKGKEDGVVNAIVCGGTGTYNYLWSNKQWVSKNALNDKLKAGSYSVTIEDANYCKVEASITLNEPQVLELITTSKNIACAGENNGAIATQTNGGTGAVTYLWSNTSNEPSINGLTAGTYTVTATDANGCTATTNSTTITNPTAITITPTVTQPTDPSNGAISLGVAGGTGTYTYNWGGGITTQNRTGLAAGTYTVTVTDANGCTATNTSTLTSACSVITITPTVSQPTGAANGAISIAVAGGTVPYTYNWGGGITTQNRTGLAAGTYTVTVTDANGCTAMLTATITGVNYCTPVLSNSFEYISNVGINGVNNASGVAGYSDFTNVNFYAASNSTVTANLTVSFVGSAYNENWAIWIDRNKDEVFTSNEIFATTTTLSTAPSTTITFPLGILPTGAYRMRVLMQYGNGLIVNPCPTSGFGEVEDYTLNVTAPITTGNLVVNKTNNNSIGSVKNTPIFEAHYIDSNPAPRVTNEMVLTPNPASEWTKLNFTTPILAKINVSVFDIAGRMMEQKSFDNSDGIELNLNHYLNGVYMVKISSEDGQKFVKRLVVQK